MSSYSTNEHDPLLPRDNPSPEIHGSRPQSINDVYVTEAQVEIVEKNEIQPARFTKRQVLAVILGIWFLISVFMVLFPFMGNLLGDDNPEPSTNIQERVNKILTDTPLIGMFIPPSSYYHI